MTGTWPSSQGRKNRGRPTAVIFAQLLSPERNHFFKSKKFCTNRISSMFLQHSATKNEGINQFGSLSGRTSDLRPTELPISPKHPFPWPFPRRCFMWAIWIALHRKSVTELGWSPNPYGGVDLWSLCTLRFLPGRVADPLHPRLPPWTWLTGGIQKWGGLEIGVPPVIIHVNGIFPNKNYPSEGRTAHSPRASPHRGNQLMQRWMSPHAV